MFLHVSVPGVPAPQGSLRSLGTGRPSVHSNAATLLPWRAAVIAHVRQVMQTGGEWPVEGPVQAEATFFLPRPKSAPAWRIWPDKKPDLDKLQRAAGDALEQAGALRSDAQIVLWKSSKQYGPPGMDLRLRTLEQPVRRAS